MPVALRPAVALALIALAGCDAAPGFADEVRRPTLAQVAISPAAFALDSDAPRATVPLAVTGTLDADGPVEVQVLVRYAETDSLVIETVAEVAAGAFRVEAPVVLPRGATGEYSVRVTTEGADGRAGDQASAVLRFQSANLGPPVVTVNQPNAVGRPTGTATVRVPLVATVTDPDGRENVRAVVVLDAANGGPHRPDLRRRSRLRRHGRRRALLGRRRGRRDVRAGHLRPGGDRRRPGRGRERADALHLYRPMTRALLLWALLASATGAQTVETGRGTATLLPPGARNGVAVLDAAGGVLRAGPVLVQVAPNGDVSIPGLAPAFDPATTVDPRVFAVDARGDVVVVSLAYNDVTASAEQPPVTTAGFAVSTDAGRTYTYRFPALDQSRDSTVTYGVSTLPAFPTTLSQGSAALDVALTAGADTIYAAGLLAGLRRSTNAGATWQRVVLPPDSLFVLDPREPYDFLYNPDVRQPVAFIDGDPDRPVFAQFSENFVAFSVVVDEAGTVWVGTNGGLNRSVRVPGADDFAWVRYTDALLGGSLPGNQVFALETRSLDGRDEVWAVCRNSGNPFTTDEEEDGVAVWRGDDADGFAVFETVLLGVVAEDVAFDDERAYVAAADGLYVSDDDGATWRVVRVFRDAAGQALPVGPRARAVATTPGTVWVGVSGPGATGNFDPASGLLRSADGGRTWTLFRADVRPQADAEDSRPVDVYAYPNPFNPRAGDLRVRLDLAAPADVTVRLYDVAMNLVRTLDAPGRPAGPNEVSWDGQSDGGLRVANGAYIYTVDAGDTRSSGRILVIQ